MSGKRILVTGAGGFIGSHLVGELKRRGHTVYGVDLKEPEWGWPTCAPDEFAIADLREPHACRVAAMSMDWVFDLAADMGGIGYIHSYHAQIAYNNSMISTNMLEAAHREGVERYCFSSSACAYPLYLQGSAEVLPLREEDAYPALPEDAYGWQKLMHEQMCRYYREDYGLETRVARFHNVFGPYTAFDGGKEKAPAALCRKAAIANLKQEPEIEIWGDGHQTRSFCYIDDCVRLLIALMESDYAEPINIGTDRLVTIDELVDLIPSQLPLTKKHVPGTQGVRGRNADLTRMKKYLGEPQVSLEEGMERTYRWIFDQVKAGL